MSNIMEKSREESRKKFLSLSPVERIKTMEKVFYDILKVRARAEGLSEYGIYKQYLDRGKKDSRGF